MIIRREHVPPLEEYCLYPIPQDYESFTDSIKRIPFSTLNEYFVEKPDSRSYEINDLNLVILSEILTIDPYISLDTEVLQNLRSNAPVPDNLLSEENYIRAILKHDNSKLTNPTYHQLCHILDKYSVFRGSDLADFIKNRTTD